VTQAKVTATSITRRWRSTCTEDWGTAACIIDVLEAMVHYKLRRDFGLRYPWSSEPFLDEVGRQAGKTRQAGRQ